MATHFVVLSAAILVAATARAQQEYVPYIQERRLIEIGNCKTDRCVDAVVSRAPYVDPPLRLIAAAKLHELTGKAAHARLLDAMPKDPVAFWFCYSVTTPTFGKEFAKVRALYDTYFPAAADAAVATGKVKGFLLLAFFADGEMAAALAEDVERIRERNRIAYCSALNMLHAEVVRSLPPCHKAP